VKQETDVARVISTELLALALAKRFVKAKVGAGFAVRACDCGARYLVLDMTKAEGLEAFIIRIARKFAKKNRLLLLMQRLPCSRKIIVKLSENIRESNINHPDQGPPGAHVARQVCSCLMETVEAIFRPLSSFGRTSGGILYEPHSNGFCRLHAVCRRNGRQRRKRAGRLWRGRHCPR